MSAHGPAFPPAWLVNGLANIQTAAANWNRYQVRAVGRMIGGIIPGAFLASSLTDITDALPGSTDRTLDIAVAAVSGAALLILLRKFGQGRGILWGLWVWFVSWVWWQSLVLSAYTAWLAVGMEGDPTDWTEVAITALLSAALFIPTNMALKNRLDPDF